MGHRYASSVAQNIYDDEEFFAGYSRLRRSVDGLAGAPEWATLRSLLPSLPGSRVVDLGCGFGWFCRWAADHGAASVLGIDLSERMLARARRETDDGCVEYRRQDLDEIDLEPGFDLAYSGLTLHYIEDLDRLLGAVQRMLVPGGFVVFSVEHPIFTAPARPGFVEGPDESLVWPIDSYLVEGERETDWLAPGVIKHHRTIGSYLSALRRSGFTLEELVEWGPSDEQIAEVPEWAAERHRPPFLLISAKTPGIGR